MSVTALANVVIDIVWFAVKINVDDRIYNSLNIRIKYVKLNVHHLVFFNAANRQLF